LCERFCCSIASKCNLTVKPTAGDDRFRGIRHSVTWDASEMFSRGRTNSPKGQMADATWRAGFARLAPLNLTFEAWLYHPQLMELADLARAFPQTTIILNHVGGPLGIGPYADKKEETFAVWKAGIAELGKCQNVVVKLGGSRRATRRYGWRRPHRPSRTLKNSVRAKQYIGSSKVTLA
jgi:L-fuconolactonase